MVANNKMGVLGAISYVIGNIVGSGIFFTPKTVLKGVHTVGMSLVVWLVGALISMIGAFCYVELGTSISSSGADFAYLCYIKWYPLAFAFMCTGCFLLFPAALSIQSGLFSEYFIQGFGIEFADPTIAAIIKKLIAFSLLCVIMFLNFFSMRTFVSRFQIVATVAKVGATSIIIITGFFVLIFRGKTENLSKPFEGSHFDAGSYATALFAGFFAYDGWDILNFGTEEIEKPRRTMPLAITIGMLIVALIYFLVNVSYFIVLDVNEILESSAIASTFANAELGEFSSAIPLLICILLVGSLNSTIFSASRYLYAASREGHLPKFISCTNEETDSPRVAIFFSIIVSLLTSFAGDLDTLINYVGFVQWSQRICTILALLWIRFRHIHVNTNALRVPIFIPIIFLIICSTLVFGTIASQFDISKIGLIILAASLIVYFVFMSKYSLRCFKWYRVYSSAIDDASTKVCQVIFNAVPAEGSMIVKMDEKAPNTQEQSGNFAKSNDSCKPPL